MNIFNKGTCMIIIKDKKLLMIKRGDNRKWSFPGGKVDKGETYLDAVIRETKEESGIEVSQAEYICDFSSIAKVKGNVSIVKSKAFIAAEYAGIPRVINSREVLDVKFIDISNLVDLDIFMPTSAVISHLIEKGIIS